MPLVHTITLTDSATPLLGSLRRLVTTPDGKRRIHGRIAAAAEELARTHVIGIARLKHGTAERLGATPTGFYADAASAVRSYHDTLSAAVLVDHPGFARYSRDVVLRPKAGKKFLTIPISKKSYGRRAGEFANLFLKKAKNGRLYLCRNTAGKKIEPLFLLLTNVTQKQDKSLMPSPPRFKNVAEKAARELIRDQVEASKATRKS
jgi:hypothetical protein